MSAFLFIYDWLQKKKESIVFSKFRAWAIASFFAITFFGMGAVSTWLWTYQPKPEVVIQKVEVPIPCPPSQTGDATTHGTYSPAITGTGNTTSVNAPPVKPSK